MLFDNNEIVLSFSVSKHFKYFISVSNVDNSEKRPPYVLPIFQYTSTIFRFTNVSLSTTNSLYALLSVIVHSFSLKYVRKSDSAALRCAGSILTWHLRDTSAPNSLKFLA